MVEINPKLGKLHLPENMNFVWIRANPDAGTTEHAMDHWGNYNPGVAEREKSGKSSGWHDKSWSSGSASWKTNQ
jgi:hypothetical protein